MIEEELKQLCPGKFLYHYDIRSGHITEHEINAIKEDPLFIAAFVRMKWGVIKRVSVRKDVGSLVFMRDGYKYFTTKKECLKEAKIHLEEALINYKKWLPEVVKQLEQMKDG